MAPWLIVDAASSGSCSSRSSWRVRVSRSDCDGAGGRKGPPEAHDSGRCRSVGVAGDVGLRVVGSGEYPGSSSNRKVLEELPAVKSVDVELDSNFAAGDSWSVLILLNKNPGREETLTVLKDAYDRVVQVVGDDFASVTASWVQNGASVSWPISANEPNGAELDYLRELAKPGRGAMSAGRGRISVTRGVVKEFPADLIVTPRSGVSVSDSFELDGMSIRAVSDTVDLSPIPLRKVVEAIDSKYREGAVVELTDNDIVSGSISLDVAAFGKESDGLDVAAAAKVLNVVSGNQLLQELGLTTAWNTSVASREGVFFHMKAGAFDAGDPPEEGAKILAAAQKSASASS